MKIQACISGVLLACAGLLPLTAAQMILAPDPAPQFDWSKDGLLLSERRNAFEGHKWSVSWPRWNKTFDIDGDNRYGSAGHVLFAAGESPGSVPKTPVAIGSSVTESGLNWVKLPEFIESITFASSGMLAADRADWYNVAITKPYPNTQVDKLFYPGVFEVPASALERDTSAGGKGWSYGPALTITIAQDAYFRLGILSDFVAPPLGPFVTDGFRLQNADGTNPTYTLGYGPDGLRPTAGHGPDLFFFDVKASAGDVLVLYAGNDDPRRGALFNGIFFDRFPAGASFVAPEPAATNRPAARAARPAGPVTVDMGRPETAIASALAALPPSTIAADFATPAEVDSWLRHPIFGEPSFDAFERLPANPLLTGSAPFEWPVNGSLFIDPVSENFYIFTGEYPQGYVGAGPPETRVQARAGLLRSTDRGQSWEYLGAILTGTPDSFDRGGLTPDVTVVYADGLYHMVYDWATPDWPGHRHEGGNAYAWAERPEGPWHKHTESIILNSHLRENPVLGKYARAYCATLIRRQNDWLLLGEMDAPPAWALYAQTAASPKGPWSEPEVLIAPDFDDFLPPLIEHFPAFVHDGYVYQPGTSVALNRNFQMLKRAPIESAHRRDAWEIVRHGSLWHSQPVPHEHFGIWGQTFSGQVDADGTFYAMFPSRNEAGMGTINIAKRPWDQPFRERGFVLNGHQGPAFTLLQQAWSEFSLETEFSFQGTARLIWDYAGVLGPERTRSNTGPHPMALRNYTAVEFQGSHYRVLRVESTGREVDLHRGTFSPDQNGSIRLVRSAGETTLFINDEPVLQATTEARPSLIGWLVLPHTFLEVERFSVTGKAAPAVFSYFYNEAILGAGAHPGVRWEQVNHARYRTGSIMQGSSASHSLRVKWNFIGQQVALWLPKGPDYGSIEVVLNGEVVAELDLYSPQPEASQPVWISPRLPTAPYALVIRANPGTVIPVDSIEVMQ